MRKHIPRFHIYTKKEGFGLQAMNMTYLKLEVLLRENFQGLCGMKMKNSIL